LDHCELTLRSAWTNGVSNLIKPKFWIIGIAFLATYLALNIVTGWYQLDGLGITLWSPDDGLSVLLLMEGAEFVPLVLVAEVLADVLINHVHHSLYVAIVAECALTLGYAAIAVVLRYLLNFNLRRTHLADVVSLLLAVPVGSALTSLMYCGTLYLAAALPADQFYTAMHHFWLGDTVGIIAIIPAATAIFTFLSKARWRWRRYDALSWSVFIVGLCWGLALLHSAIGANHYHPFYPLFLPIIWIGMRLGYAGVAIALLVTQIAFFLTASYIGFDINDFDAFQILLLVLSITGLLLGAVITEREHATLLLREQQTELARVSAYATAGAMGMLLAHELSQPLSTVTTYMLAARRMLQSGAGSELVIDALGKAEAEAQRTRQVLERVRDFVSAGKMELRLLDLVEIALQIRALCLEEANARKVDIVVNSIRPIPLVKADKVGVEQVLNNLVANAIDAAAERGDARGMVIIRLADGDDRVVVHVDDNGPGVAPEMAESLFEAYQTTKRRGMGLGLTLSRQIVQKHGGRLWWQPIKPEGTRLVVELKINGPDINAV
jgi:two-component system sensor kinase FixL